MPLEASPVASGGEPLRRDGRRACHVRRARRALVLSTFALDDELLVSALESATHVRPRACRVVSDELRDTGRARRPRTGQARGALPRRLWHAVDVGMSAIRDHFIGPYPPRFWLAHPPRNLLGMCISLLSSVSPTTSALFWIFFPSNCALERLRLSALAASRSCAGE